MAKASLAPNVADPYAPLSATFTKALRIYGETNPAGADGAAMLMAVDFANEIIDLLHVHPYWTGGQLDYYVSPEEIRPIPDRIVQAGLLYLYAEQQGSEKTKVLYAKFTHTMNSILYNMKYGGSIRHELGVVDGDDVEATG